MIAEYLGNDVTKYTLSTGLEISLSKQELDELTGDLKSKNIQLVQERDALLIEIAELKGEEVNDSLCTSI